MQGNEERTMVNQSSQQSQETLKSPLDPRFLTPSDIAREMKADGISVESLFTKAQNAPVHVLDPQKLANDEANARAKADGDSKANAEEPKSENKTVEPTTTTLASKSKIEPKFFDEAPDEPKQSPTDAGTDSPDSSEEKELELTEASVENFKKLKNTYRDTKKALKIAESEKKTAEEKLKTYVPPEILEEKETRIAELTRYEKIHNLKASPEYREKYVAPLNQNYDRLKTLLKDYGVPEDSLDTAVKHAMSLGNEAELNNFLSDHFSDRLGAEEAKGVIKSIRQLQTDARAAEAEPVRTMESLHEQNAALATQREGERRQHVTKVARNAWEEVMYEIQKEGEIKELIPVEDDPEFNENFPHKLIRQAASEYGKLITEMAKTGVTPTKEIARALAKMTALSQVAGIAIITRNRAMTQADEIVRNSERTAGLYRPGTNGSGSGRAPMDAGTTQHVDPAAQLKSDVGNLVNTVLSKR